VDQKSKARKSEGKKPEPKKDAGKMAVFDRHDVKSMEDKPTPAKPAKKVGQKRKRKR
jgi:hypothetical protein